MSYWGFRRSLSRLPFDRDWRMASSLQHRELHDLIRIWEMCSGSSNRPTWVRHSKLIVTDMLTGYCEVLWLIVFRILWSHKSMRDTLHPTGKHFRRCLAPRKSLAWFNLAQPGFHPSSRRCLLTKTSQPQAVNANATRSAYRAARMLQGLRVLVPYLFCKKSR